MSAPPAPPLAPAPGSAAASSAPFAAPVRPFTSADVFRAWAPLAASWLLMGLELPVVSAVLARLADPKVHLAAYGSVVFPVSMLIEAPIIMLLAASTALSRDLASFRLMRRWMMGAGAVLTVLHAAVAFTPLFDLAVGRLIHPPPEVLGPARLGLQVMTPWTWAIAYRRFHQGVLIREGRAHVVGLGTGLRLLAMAAVLAVGGFVAGWPGIVTGSAASAAGVLVEALYIGLRSRSSVTRYLPSLAPVSPRLSSGAFLAFYVPLALTTVLYLLNQPQISAAMSRMPEALGSLAVWPVVGGLTFTFRSLGIAFNEVVVAQYDRPGAPPVLRRFCYRLAGALAAAYALLGLTPLGGLYLRFVAALPADLARLAAHALWIALPLPLFGAWQSWHQALLVHRKETRSILGSVGINLLVSAGVLALGVAWGRAPAIYFGVAALVLGQGSQILWLRSKTRRFAIAAGASAQTAT